MSDDGSGREVRVVESMRLPPGLERAARGAIERFRRLPELAQVFIALAAVDVLARLLGLIGPRIVLDLGAPVATLSSVLPHSALILLPALLVLRRPTAPADTPSIVDGAVFIGLAELLSFPTSSIANEIGGVGAWAATSIAAIGVQVVGWVAIGRGLARLNPVQPSDNASGLGNLAAFAILGGTAVSLVLFLSGPGYDVGDPQTDGLLALNTIAQILAIGVLAYVARAVLRGLDDDSRPELARRTGATAALLAGGLSALGLVVELLAAAGQPMAVSVSQAPAWGALRWLWIGGSTTLLVAAFGLGLADPATRPAEQASTLERA